MAPLHTLLSSKNIFTWSDELQGAFDSAKQVISDKVNSGVRTFVVGRPMALITDWSKAEVGYVLLQKICLCPNVSPHCCEASGYHAALGHDLAPALKTTTLQ